MNDSVKDTSTEKYDHERPILQAKTVYLYMGSEARVSRSSRMQWLIDHLDEIVTVPVVESLDKITKAIEIVSVIPEEQGTGDWLPDTSHLYQYYIRPQTKLLFLSRRYCLTYCLDMSPSLSAVDTQNGEVMMDKVFTCLKTSLEGVSKSFMLPGSTLVFHPEIYVSIIANTPFFITPAQQVLLQSWHVTSDNISDLFKNVHAELLKLENAIAQVSNIFINQLEATRVESDNMVGGLFEEDRSKRGSAPVAMVNPDQGFINMLRFGMLALRLLPAASCAGIIVVTDGVITLPDAYLLDATLNRLRSTGICCSFLHVGSPFHPHCGQGRVPYSDLMTFVASASLGVHMTNIPEVNILDFRDLQMNRYHRAFLGWSFQSYETNDSDDPATFKLGQWYVSNPAFGSCQDLRLLKKKQLEESLNVPLVKMLCCRIREGYIVRRIDMSENQIEIKLLLAWKSQIHLECNVRSKWPPSHTVHYTLFIKAPYEFLHDISCSTKKNQASFRQAVVSRFWLTLRNYVQSDYLMVHLHSKETNPHWNSIPESVKSGMPLFFSSSSGPGLAGSVTLSNDVITSQFIAFWKPISLLDPDAWHKWLHTYRIGLILRHDYPFPRNLHLTNSSGRFQTIHCRQAATALQAMLRNITTFVLVDNKCFVKLVPPETHLSNGWFYIITLTCKQPCVVINLAFPCGTPSKKRQSIVTDLKTQLSELQCSLSTHERVADRLSSSMNAPISRKCSRVTSCIVLQKPVEKILIRYKKMPSTFDTVIFPDGTQSLMSAKSSFPESGKSGYLVTTLSRYLHHKRWIWSAQNAPGSSLGIPAVARILSTITEMRLKEGFSFAHSQSGIVNMLLEVQMQGNPELGEEVSRCVVQYVLFPPHMKPDDDKIQYDGESDEEESERILQIVTESWVEPHSGLVGAGPAPRAYMDQLPYNKLSDTIANVDAQCISLLLTFEHLSLMARNKAVPPPTNLFVAPDISQLKDRVIVYHDGVSICDDRIHHVPFLFNLVNILPKCRQAELLFSMPIQDLTGNWQVPSKLIDNTDSLNPDVKNASLMELIFDQLSKLHDRELHLTQEDSVLFVEHLHRRERNSDVYPIPIPKCGDSSAAPPGWKCYLKGIDPEHITLTFIPAGYNELKTLMSNKAASEDMKSLKTLTLDDNSIGEFVDWGRKRQSGNSDQLLQETMISVDRINCHSTPVQDSARKRDQLDESNFFNFESSEGITLKNHKSSLQSISTSESQLRSVCESTSLSGSQSRALESTDISFQRMFSAMARPYRDRASSLDTNFDRARRGNVQMSGYNLRTTSMEAKIWGNRSVAQSSGVTRSNTQASEMSGEHVDKSSNADATSDDILQTVDAEPIDIQDSSKVFSTIPLPIFIYDCPLVNLIDALVHKDTVIKSVGTG
ncbi:hypothetical protein RUM44_007725 [Polyplax serrata]|uniref:Protein SZT2 n=1 Tax=Polyplax serrata TaxID=468196 RepID=A0ABR1B750_POLSC